jgi:hypothetical protein
LRVVTRVYLTQSVLATIMADKTFGAGVLAGAAEPIDVPQAQPAETVANYDATLEALNESLKSQPLAPDMLPGGSIQVVAASGRTISLQEEFPRPPGGASATLGQGVPHDERRRGEALRR